MVTDNKSPQIIPIGGDFRYNDEEQNSYKSIQTEMVVSMYVCSKDSDCLLTFTLMLMGYPGSMVLLRPRLMHQTYSWWDGTSCLLLGTRIALYHNTPLHTNQLTCAVLAEHALASYITTLLIMLLELLILTGTCSPSPIPP